MATNTAPHFTFDKKGQVITDFFGYSDAGASVTLQADGKILVAGTSSKADFKNDFALARYNSDGSLDTDFSSDGKVTTALGPGDDFGYAVAVQADGKILVAGTRTNNNNADFALVRYNSDGSLDTGFSNDGKVITALGYGDDSSRAVAVQADGKILVAGTSDNVDEGKFYFALLRYNSDGSLDTGFSGDGKVTTSFGSTSSDFANSIRVQADGKILVAGNRSSEFDSDFALARYNSDGSLDTSFSGDGLVTTSFGFTANDVAASLTLQADGKILVAGSSNGRFALVRYNSDGSLDTDFSGDGRVTTTLGSYGDYGNSVTVQANGKILVAGSSSNHASNSSDGGIALVRYNSDGSLDTGFSGDGIVMTAVSSRSDVGNSVTVQADGKIVVAGISYNGAGVTSDGDDFAIVRYNADGSLDNTFGVPVNTLDGVASYTENGPAVILDSSANIYDAELDALYDDLFSSGNPGNYNGASITLARHGGPDSEDVFSILDSHYFSGGNLYFETHNSRYGDIHLGAVSNSNGVLTITFNGNASHSRVNNVLSSLTYSNTSDTPPASVRIDWTFNDGNTGAQGTGGALTALGSTLVNITPAANTPPSFIFDEEGKVITDFFGYSDFGNSVAVQADGKILVAGTAGRGISSEFALVRYNEDGSLDTDFSGDGKITALFGSNRSFGNSVALQTDGNIIVGGSIDDRFALARYLTDGSLDTAFSGDGLVTTSFGPSSSIASVVVQADGKILAAGTTTINNSMAKEFALARYNSDGSLDTGFSGDGKVTTSFSSFNFFNPGDSASSVIVQADGKILVAGTGHNFDESELNSDFALVRYNSDGSLDTGFSGDGIVTTSFGSNSFDRGRSVSVQADGKILVAGTSNAEGNFNAFALARYNSDGSLDTGFSGDGKVTTALAVSYDSGNSVTVQAGGKILVAGSSGGRFTLVRYNSDGSLDTGFSDDGIVITALGASSDSGNSVTVQADGKIVLAGSSNNGGGPESNESNFAVLRYNADGSLDNTFGVPVNTLDGVASYTENGEAVILDRAAYIYDAELREQGNYDGASITLARHGARTATMYFQSIFFFILARAIYLIEPYPPRSAPMLTSAQSATVTAR